MGSANRLTIFTLAYASVLNELILFIAKIYY